MCGIVGMVSPTTDVGRATARQLAVLEYRGYDSWGLTTLGDCALTVIKDVGSIGRAIAAGGIDRIPPASLALGHTRWATHGGVTRTNAHPHLSYDGRVAIAHNGVIENHAQLRRELEADGITLTSGTDSEVAAHLIARHLGNGSDMVTAIAATVGRLAGEYALAIVATCDPTTVWGAKHKSPLLAAHNGERGVLASDHMALDGTDAALVLEDGDIVALRSDGAQVHTRSHNGRPRSAVRAYTPIDHGYTRAEKGDHPHWMIKEIHETPDAATTALELPADRLDTVLPSDRLVTLLGAGSAYYVSAMGSYLLASLAGVQSVAVPADEADYLMRLHTGDPVIAISQSGETFDTLEACRSAVAAGAIVTSICNVPNSTQERLATHLVQQGSGPEVCVLSTKSIVSQVVLLARLALETGRTNGTLSDADYHRHAESLTRLPHTLRRFIDTTGAAVRSLAATYRHVNDWFFLGRGILFPTACESALKFKEVNYHHAEGMAAGMVKHGTISLIDENFHTVALLPSAHAAPRRYGATLAAVSEIAARGGPVIGIGPTDTEPDDLANFVEYLPLPCHHDDIADPVLHLVTGQMLAYYCAVFLGREIDQPRSLAKSVTVR